MTAALLLTFLAIPWTSFAQSGAETSDIQEPALQPTARLTAFPLPAELCQTTLNCRRSTARITTITKTDVPGLCPLETATLTPCEMPSDSAATVTVVPPCTNTKRTVTSTISPGATLSTSLPSSREPGEPETHIIIPGGSGFPETHTVTSTLPGKHLPDRTIVLPGRDPPPGETKTEVTVIPPTTTGLEGKVTACPPEVTVTVTRQASAAPMVNVSNEHGEVIKKPASKFPCSDNDLNPCRGTQVKPWTGFSVVWNAQYPRPGQPAPFATTIDYPYDTLLTVTDDEYQAEHWTIKLDGAKIGESHEEGFMNNKLYCGKDADGCIAKGFSHGTFMIPKGSHSVSFEWTKGPYKTDAGWNWWYGAGQYRLDKPCTCGSGSSGHAEL